MKLSHLVVVAVVLTCTVVGSSVSGQPAARRAGTGHELLQACTLYFSFLGRTGAGREETFREDPFGMGYCAGLVRGVTTSVDAFHPEIECRLEGVAADHAVRAVVSYLSDYPQNLDEPDSVLVLRALQRAYICSGV